MTAEARRDRVARNTSVVLAVLTLVLAGVVIFQQNQLEDLRAVDCAAKAERQARVMLYDRIIEAWKQSEDVAVRQEMIDAYRSQRAAVAAVVIAQEGAECSMLPRSDR